MKALKLFVAICLVAGFSANQASAQKDAVTLPGNFWFQDYVPCFNNTYLVGNLPGMVKMWDGMTKLHAKYEGTLHNWWGWPYQVTVVANGTYNSSENGAQVLHWGLSCEIVSEVTGRIAIASFPWMHETVNANGETTAEWLNKFTSGWWIFVQQNWKWEECIEPPVE